MFLRMFDRVFTLQLTIAVGVFVVIVSVLLFALARNRASRRTTLPFRRSTNTPVEVGLSVLLAGAAAFLAWLSIGANDALSDPAQAAGASAVGDPGAAPATRIGVTGFQWCWRFDYREAPVSVTGTCADRAAAPTMVVPIGQPVRLELTSRDVVHSFWIPDLAVKKDVMPDHVNTVTITFDRQGRWLGRCSEYCGTHHVTMDFYVQAVPPEQYRQWLAHGGGQLT